MTLQSGSPRSSLVRGRGSSAQQWTAAIIAALRWDTAQPSPAQPPSATASALRGATVHERGRVVGQGDRRRGGRGGSAGWGMGGGGGQLRTNIVTSIGTSTYTATRTRPMLWFTLWQTTCDKPWPAIGIAMTGMQSGSPQPARWRGRCNRGRASLCPRRRPAASTAAGCAA